MKKLILIFCLVSYILNSQSLEYARLNVRIPSYTQSELDTYTTSLSPNEVNQQFWNSTTQKVQIWNGTLLVNSSVPHPSTLGTGVANSSTYLNGLCEWVTIASGGDMLKSENLSGLTNYSTARTNLSLGNVNNTSDASKPVSTLQQTALDLKANLISASLVTPLLGTPISGNLINCTFPTLNQNTTGSAGTLTTPRNINGVSFNGSADITVTSDANTLSGTNLKSTVITSSLTTLGIVTQATITVAGAITSSGGGIGYAVGSGSTITQATSRTTAVTLNKLCGNITMFSSAQADNALVTFTFNNSFISAGDFVLIQHISATNGGAWVFSVVAGAGSCTISIANRSGASITSATPLRFTIIKGVTN